MKEAGIEVLKHEERQLTDEEARDFYGHLKDEPFFDELVEFMCSGPSHVLLLSKPDTGESLASCGHVMESLILELLSHELF